MTESTPQAGAGALYRSQSPTQVSGGRGGATNLGDILERVLDKGLVIAGDIQVNLLDIELLTIKLRLVIASLDTAREVGINWWQNDPWLNAEAAKQAVKSKGSGNDGELGDGVQELKEELSRLRGRIKELESGDGQ